METTFPNTNSQFSRPGDTKESVGSAKETVLSHGIVNPEREVPLDRGS